MFLITIITSGIPSEAKSDKLVEEKVLKYIDQYCSDLKKDIVLGIIRTESNFKNQVNRRARIPTFGYMQIQLPTARSIKCAKTQKQLMNPWINIKCGCEYLRIHLNKYGDYESAVAAYNAGVAINCNRKRKKCRSKKLRNQKYVNVVFRHATKYVRYL